MQCSILEVVNVLFVVPPKTEQLLHPLGDSVETIVTCDSYEDALDLYHDNKFEIVIVDIFLDYHDENNTQESSHNKGIFFLKKIREYDKKVGLILVSKMPSKENLFNLLYLHIDGYIIADSVTLLDEVKSSIKQHVNISACIGDINDCSFYSYASKTIIYHDRSFTLNNHESLFLELLLNRRGYLLYYAEIEYEIWPDKEMSKDALKTLAKNLRKKLPQKQLINVASQGYRLL
jgi:two-component system, OmpR family, response regulator VanR